MALRRNEWLETIRSCETLVPADDCHSQRPAFARLVEAKRVHAIFAEPAAADARAVS